MKTNLLSSGNIITLNADISDYILSVIIAIILITLFVISSIFLFDKKNI